MLRKYWQTLLAIASRLTIMLTHLPFNCCFRTYHRLICILLNLMNAEPITQLVSLEHYALYFFLVRTLFSKVYCYGRHVEPVLVYG